MRVFAPLGLFLLLSACSETPTETKAKEPEKPPAPITAQQAFQLTYPAARAWAGDSLPLRIRSINLAEVPSEAGKTGAWEIIYVSAMLQRGQMFTWSAMEAKVPCIKTFSAPTPNPGDPAGSPEMPFQASSFHTDSPAALETAMTGAKIIWPNPEPNRPINFLLGIHFAISGCGVAGDVGRNRGLSSYTVFVSAATGQVVGKD